ncbi:hypothetical protein LCGC14_1520490, partial [marine sediment metagenome]
MRKSRNAPLLFFIMIISIQLISVLGFGVFENKDLTKNPINISNMEFLSFNPSKDIFSNDIGTGSIPKNKESVFDDSISNLLKTLPKFSNNNQKRIKIILLFEESTSKAKRLEIVSSLFENYNIINNYDLIPGTYMEVNPYELLSKESILEEINDIKRIYKSKILESPFILEDSLQLNALDNNLYLNWWVEAVGAENLTYDGSGVRVAVVDTGIYNHPGLNIVANQNFVFNESDTNYNDDVGHGTHVAGIVGGDGSGSQGLYKGIAPGVSIINARAGNNSGLLEGDIISAIQWSSKPVNLGGAGANIISMSFGGGYPYISDVITQAISNATKTYNVIFVASAGNSGPGFFTGSTPASGIDVISVGAIDKEDNLASFSSWGPTFQYLGYPDVVAPGVNIISAEAKDSTISKEERYIGNYFDFSGDADYIPLSGTSMAAPVVSGALAILKEAYPYLTPETARIALLEGARKIPSQTEDDTLKSGAGIINVSASLIYLNSLSADYNDTAKLFPDILPVKPYDLLHFPGDHQKFNLTVISGKSKIYDLEVPNNIQGVSIKFNNLTIGFSDSGVEFRELEIKIKDDAIPGTRNIQINLTAEAQIYDVIDITLDIRLPEHRILMESFH